jgi:hypothetical protein
MHTCKFEELRDLALSKRRAGLLTLDYRDISTPAPSLAGAADAMVARHGFRPLHNEWRIIQRPQALISLQQILLCDLAYQQPLMEKKTAHFIADSFLALFSPHNSCYCTNGFFSERNMLTWTPITQSTFDHGVIAFDEKHIGMIWAQDED